MEDKKAWTAKTLFAKLNFFIRPKVELTVTEEARISNIYLSTLENKHLLNLCSDENNIRIIANVLQSLSSANFDIKTNLLELLTGNSGYLYELLAYRWLLKRDVRFTPQVKVALEDVLSNKSYDTILDGMFLNWNIYFNIKSFEVPSNIKDAIVDKLSNRFPDFNIMIEGNYDSDFSELARLTLEKATEIEKLAKNSLLDNSSDCKKNTTWSHSVPELGVSIKFERKNVSGSIHMAEGTFDPYCWAMNNEVFFLKNAEQYTTKRPFVLICPYRNFSICGDKESIKISLRSISRRAFVKFHFISTADVDYERYNKEVHRKIDNKFSIAKIASYLSGILFIDIAKKPICENGFFFANPNSIKKLEYFHLEQIFNYETQNMPYYDNFAYDN